MTAGLILIRQSLKRIRTLIIAMALLLAIFQVFLIVVAGSIQRSGSFEPLGEIMPPFVRQMLGPSFVSLMSFSGIVCLGYFHLAVMGSLVGLSIALGTMLTSEIETGFMDLILSRPLGRQWIITRSIIVMIVCTLGTLAMMILGTWVGLNALAPRGAAWPAPRLILSLAINLAALMLCWNAIAMAIGSASRRRSVAGGLAGILALTTFLLDYVARAWEPAEHVAWLSPFRYYSPFEMLMGNPLSTTNLLVLVGIAAGSFALAYVLFARRDISH
ncbi:MAG TPA: ABC transporter permease subunit [Blastocatellia bacterium]|nr:ABC transporter permease subunit [Blastocatellia bacterium]